MDTTPQLETQIRSLIAAGQMAAARDQIDGIEPPFARAVLSNELGMRYAEMGDDLSAIQCHDLAASLVPGEYVFRFNAASARLRAGQLEMATGHFYDLTKDFGYQQLAPWKLLCVVLLTTQRLAEAIDVALQALQAWPDDVDLLGMLGHAYADTGDYAQSLAVNTRLVTLRPDHWKAWNNVGAAYTEFGLHVEALAAYERTLALQPACEEAIYNAGMVAYKLRQWPESLAYFGRIPDQSPFASSAAMYLLTVRRYQADWQDHETRLNALLHQQSDIEARPFDLLSLTDDDAYIRPETEAYVSKLWRNSRPDAAAPMPDRHDRLRIGYLSHDFRAHATAFLIAEIFELHDRERFETFGYSTGPDDGSPMRLRLENGIDSFYDFSHASPDQIVEQIRADEIDILVDLKGYTGDHSLGILKERLAPVQVHWLGYPGLLAAPGHIDYVICDDYVVPETLAENYPDGIAYLPHCYQPNDRKRAVTPPGTRADHGLPDGAFVFCCFNQVYKITPELFAVWMQILRETPGSVLWLLAETDEARANLKRETMQAGIDPDRLIFAPFLPFAEHVARIAHADLALDTFPYNAHTLASDTLWAGVPLLTLSGRSFASRVAGSLLRTVGLEALITHRQDEYAQLAAALAHDPARLASLRRLLDRERLLQTPLYDTPQLTRDLEHLFTQMWALQKAGQSAKYLR
ncbi:MAG: tetratricopeptide repeat protein [Burkholderiales bacterium]|nr:tetratricopeptide repeat protein [Burkholderiales bacterium]